MNIVLIEKHNRKVKKDDTVFMLGDFMPFERRLTNVRRVLEKLNGTKHLILGNHDENKTNGKSIRIYK
jgi:calcineurin-like phosphoesterase family protein